MSQRFPLPLLAVLLSILFGSPDLFAQEEEEYLSPEALELQLKSLEATTEAGDRTSADAKAVANYQEALRTARERERLLIKAADFQRQIEAISGDGEGEPVAAEASAPLQPNELPPQASEPGEFSALAAKLESLKSALAAARALVEFNTKAEASRSERIELLPNLISKATATEAELPDPVPPLASASEAERSAYHRLLNQIALLKQERETLQLELQFLEASAGDFAAEGAQSKLRLAALTNSTQAWQQLIDQRRLAATDTAAEEARTKAKSLAGNPRAEKIAAETVELTTAHGDLSRSMASASQRLARIRSTSDRVSRQYASAQRRVKLLEDAKLQIDAATGQLLRRQRQDFPEAAQLRRQLRDVLAESARAQIDLIDLDARQSARLAEDANQSTAEPKLAKLKATRAQELGALLEDQRRYIATLSESTTLLQNLIKEAGLFTTFIDERLLWIRSAPPIGTQEFKSEAQAVADLFVADPFASMRADLLQHPLAWLAAILIFIVLLVRRRAHRSKLIEFGAQARRRNCTSFAPTAKALGATLLIAAPLPFAFWFLYARSTGVPEGISSGIRNVAGFLTFTLLFWVIAKPAGLMVDHFRMGESRVAFLRRHLRWFIPVMVPLVFFATALPIDVSSSPSAGRLFFIGVLLAMMVVMAKLLRPSAEMISWRGKANSHFARACYLIALAAPLALIVGALAGYYASVQGLRIQAIMSLWLVLFVLLIAAILHRWILVSRRRIAVKQALARRAAALAASTTAEVAPGTLPQQVASPDEVRAEAVKVVEVEEQTSRLVRAAAIVAISLGTWGIWMPTIPALSALDRITLWGEDSPPPESAPASSTSTGEAAAIGNLVPTSPATEPANSVSRRVSLQDLIASFLTLLLTFVAARNIPGLLGLTVFQRLQLQPGSSFAFTTTIRYLIVITGVVLALGWIDVTWGKVQWIAAAITLGIGFGLQEIFANFVAGLIILFERPIRLGDVVTVGDVSGRISQIRIRATTIRQFNNRELIVPNKEFITGTLVNWTLSDSILRIEVPVGIAYGSDTAKAREILLQVARDHPKILAEPAPDVLFENFGDSALGFQLRAHVGTVEDLLRTSSDLHDMVDQRFRQAGIEIAFPQSDIHIRSLPAADPGKAAPALKEIQRTASVESS